MDEAVSPITSLVLAQMSDMLHLFDNNTANFLDAASKGYITLRYQAISVKLPSRGFRYLSSSLTGL